MSESQLYRIQINGGGADLSSDQQDRLRANQAELGSRSQAAEANIAQTIEQLNQTRLKRIGRQESLVINKQILDGIKEAVKEGGIPRLKYLKEEEQVKTSCIF